MNRRFASIIFALLFATSLAACGGSTDDDDDDVANTDPGFAANTNTDQCPTPEENPLADSCIQDFFADCFNPSGSCTTTQDGQQQVGTWENGAEMVTNPSNMSVNFEFINSDGDTCVTSDAQTSGECQLSTVYTRASDDATAEICSREDGSMTITCPNGSEESYTSDEVNRSEDCFVGGDAESCKFSFDD